MAEPAPLRVLFVTPELAPWVKSGGLGDVSGGLPAALRAIGVDARLLVPAYPALRAACAEAKPVTEPLRLGGLFAPATLLAGQLLEMQPAYFIDCATYYERPGGAYQDAGGGDWPDNYLRFGLLSRVAALLASESSPLAWRPHLLHCHDWPTGLAPAYLHFEHGARAVAVMTVHNLAFQGIFPAATVPQLGLPPQAFQLDGAEFHGQLSFLKAGLAYADQLTTVSPSYAREIQTHEYGCGLDGLLRHRRERLLGVLNGIDTAVWDPAADAFLATHYDASRLEQKAVNKAALQRELGLRIDPQTPLLGMVSRLTHQKGIDLVAACVPRIAALPAQLALVGTGDPALEREIKSVAQRFPGAVSAVIRFDEALAHRIEAGADMFLMPSRFEPCGLNQMYSLRYGTPPIARKIGGLADTIVDATPEALAGGDATGFLFEAAEPEELLKTIGRALRLWRDKNAWRSLQRNGMAQDFSWTRSARRYVELFRSVVARG
jgi:starch synthase